MPGDGTVTPRPTLSRTTLGQTALTAKAQGHERKFPFLWYALRYCWKHVPGIW